ncbi:hypothetical protein J41TS4_31080 [Paenibacillus apis]|uniref:Uncharacterized protein n=1 Tax=Paenibacillus apis TaxID=1792174 RepID=A0A919Y6Q1_9BACL|nr:hypothetical protein J41TS4_31080 [Paenibacillus apis]
MAHIAQRILKRHQILLQITLQGTLHFIADNRVNRIKGDEAQADERRQTADKKDEDDPVFECYIFQPPKDSVRKFHPFLIASPVNASSKSQVFSTEKVARTRRRRNEV